MDELERYFEDNPGALARRHHAGVDAEALRHAFVVVVDHFEHIHAKVHEHRPAAIVLLGDVQAGATGAGLEADP